MKRNLLLLALLELAYWAPSRLLVHYDHGGEIEKELLWTAMRLASAVAVYLCFKNVMGPMEKTPGAKCLWPSWVAAAMVVCMATLIYSWKMPYPVNAVFAATSLIVGVREEMVYRGVLQRLLDKRYGLPVAIVLSNLAFVFYHYGALPFTPWNVFQFFTMGTILGLMYHQTGSLLFVMGVHAVYDGIQCFSPFLLQPLSLSWGVAILLATLALLVGTSRWPLPHRSTCRD